MTLVFTNGCFEVIHPGHVDFLARARALGDRLVVGVNSDASVRAIRGPGRPLVPQEDRVAVLHGLRSVDDVVIFNEPTPAQVIDTLRPDVLVKGGDWEEDLIVGAADVRARGGRILSLPLHGGYSTTRLVERIRASTVTHTIDPLERRAPTGVVRRSIEDHLEAMVRLLEDAHGAIVSAAEAIVTAMREGGRIVLSADRGSASNAEHIAAELAGRIDTERRPVPIPGAPLSRATIAAIAREDGDDPVLARQLEGQATAGDVVIVISTSVGSANLLRTAMAARQLGCLTIALAGLHAQRLASLCDLSVIVPTGHTSRVQEAHLVVGHIWCELVNAALATGIRS